MGTQEEKGGLTPQSEKNRKVLGKESVVCTRNGGGAWEVRKWLQGWKEAPEDSGKGATINKGLLGMPAPCTGHTEAGWKVPCILGDQGWGWSSLVAILGGWEKSG